MRKILLVSGCSYTDKNFKSDFHPDIDVSWPKWPAILGKKLDMDVINHGYCGSGNEYIYNSLINHLAGGTENIGLVIAGWTRVPRRDFKVGNRKYNIRWDNHGDMKYFMMKSLRYYYSLQEVCKSLKVPYKQIHILDPYESAVIEQNEMYGEGVVNRAATGVVALMVFLGLGLLAIVFAILYPIALTILPSKK